MNKYMLLASFATLALGSDYTQWEHLESPEIIDDNRKLLLSVEVARHGERAPHHIYPFAADPDENFTVPYNLTATGAESHYENGKGLRDFFDR